jgi:hypothetical protein
MSDGKPTRPSDETRAAEREDAEQHAGPDRPPTPDEEALTDQSRPDPEVAEEYEEAIERGARQKGEGRIP